MQKQKPFKVFIRREGGYESSLTVRFEVADGHGILVLQKKGQGKGHKKEPSPTLAHEERDVSATALRAGRFIHVLAGSGRRQSYALSRLTEELLQRLPDDRWTELEALTEYGFRYLVAPDEALEPEEPAAVAVAVPGKSRSAADEPDEAGRPTSSGAEDMEANASSVPSALQRAMAAIRAGRGGAEGRVAEKLRDTPRPAPTAKVSGGMAGRSSRPRTPVGASSTAKLGHKEALARVAELDARVEELERKLAESIVREKDLIEILARWQKREIES